MKLLECFLIFFVAFLLNSASAADDSLHDSSTTTSSVTSTTVKESSTSAAVSIVSSTPTPGTTSSETLTPNSTTPATASTTPAVVTTMTTEVKGSPDLMLVVNNSEIACIVAKLEITLNLEYKNANESMVTGNFVITSASVDNNKSSKCTNPAKDVVEELYAGFNDNNSLHFHFSNTSPNKFGVSLFELSTTDLRSLFTDAMPGQNFTLQSNQSIFETSANMSYKCNSEMKVNLMDSDMMATNNSVVFRMVQVEAFRTTADTNFANAIDCEADDEISNIVPIAVGCALAGLVIIVLIAYLVGRRQKRQRGYESV